MGQAIAETNRPQRPRVFVTLGDGLAAGFGPWNLGTAGRRTSFPARIARRLRVPFMLPPCHASEIWQQASSSSELKLPHQLAAPGLSLEDLFTLRPTTPLLGGGDARQEAVNLALGASVVLDPSERAPSLLEAAALHRPTHMLLCWGYDAACRAAEAKDPNLLLSAPQLRAGLDRLHRALGTTHLAILGIPDATRAPACGAEFWRKPTGTVGRSAEVQSRIAELNAAMEQWARDYDACFIHMEHALVDARHYGVDGFYPNAHGHHRLALAALTALKPAWQLDESFESLDPAIPPEPSDPSAETMTDTATDTEAAGHREPAERGFRLVQSPRQARQDKEEEARVDTPSLDDAERELTIEIDPLVSFAEMALVEAGPGQPRRPSIQSVLGGSALGLVPLSGVVELRLGSCTFRDEETGSEKRGARVRLTLPVPIRAAGVGHLQAPQLLDLPLTGLELQPLVDFEGRLGADGRVQDLAGGVLLGGAPIEKLSTACSPWPEPLIDFALHLPPRGDAYHVDLQLRAAYTLPSPDLTFALETEAESRHAGECPEESSQGQARERRLPVGATTLLLYLRLCTQSEASKTAREPQRRSTRPPLEAEAAGLHLPTLSVLEADYDLKSPALGGTARDERRLLGLTQLEIGQPVGPLQPVIARLDSPSVRHGEGCLVGFDGEVRFPKRLWRRRLPTLHHDLPSLAVAYRPTGTLLGGLALTTRTNGLPSQVTCHLPMRGRLSDDSGQLRFEIEGQTTVELPAGQSFHLSGRTGELTGASSVAFRLRLEATGQMAAPRGTYSGEERLLSSHRQLFSFRYVLPPEPGEKTLFEYQNHSTGGFFQLTCPLRLLFARSPGSRPGRQPDTVILEGLGTWSGPGPGPTGDASGAPDAACHHVIFVSRRSRFRPYVAILIDGGVTSNVEAGDT